MAAHYRGRHEADGWPRVASRVAAGTAGMVLLALATPAMASGGTTSGADLRLNGTLSNSQPAPGSTFTETYVVQNRGPDTAVATSWIDLDDPGQPGLSVAIDSVTVDGGPGNCTTTVDGNGVTEPTCNLGDLVSGAQTTIVVTRTAPATTTTYTFTGDVGSTQTSDPLTTNNDAKLTIQVTSGGGGGGGGTTTPPPGAPCATVDPSSASQTLEFTTNTMSTKISNCGTSTLTDVVVIWDAGATAPSNAHAAFDCSAPTTFNTSFTLAPGAALTVNCKKNGFDGGPTPTESGTGTVTVYDQCASPNQTLVAGGVHCTDEPQTQLAQAPFSWFLAIPTNPIPRGGGRGGTG